MERTKMAKLLPEGAYKYLIDVKKASDANNVKSEFGTVVVDNTPPTVTVDRLEVDPEI